MYIWDGNVPLHEIKKEGKQEDEITTWVFEGFTPTTKLVNGKSYSIISDYLGTPLQAIDSEGKLIWERELDIYGRVRKEKGEKGFCNMLYQGQYLDIETELVYNYKRYYSQETGAYISQDPIGLNSRVYNLYSYVSDSNSIIDVCRLDCKNHVDSDFKNGASFLITGDNYERFIKGKKIISRADGQFVAPASQINDLITKANGGIFVIEKALGILKGDWQNVVKN
ncbi:RHS repeat domain-containing protein [Capnocytophaga catalasegens]|uniref:Teneurin-like YD-shell domain-containing protein n=1 Tax=Capnocytophaga catalasegens TaxID=1004260 RepID=A0AAV5AUN5_9FLAO|nr:RHS repeat-associated core domain-containing protein [Capnocytophaga catalasegens]GIZ16447.1 hypothetical protein RCZ03_24470 [Capnocytophaga catalasegens]GJM50314.1 hypothetical protein RCZ15_12870 [Capnocytophaga catalasegens]GJM53831.1 hypothetical protein RCZ16_21470 [Capnocytophaga catalasegens]